MKSRALSERRRWEEAGKRMGGISAALMQSCRPRRNCPAGMSRAGGGRFLLKSVQRSHAQLLAHTHMHTHTHTHVIFTQKCCFDKTGASICEEQAINTTWNSILRLIELLINTHLDLDAHKPFTHALQMCVHTSGLESHPTS